MKHEKLSGILPGILAGVIFLILLFLLQWNIVVALFLAIGCYVGFHFLFKPRRRIGSRDVEDIPHGEELRRMLDAAREDFDAIAHAMNQIYDQKVWQQAKRLKLLSESILQYLEEHPERIRDASGFIDYYQDMASKLLQSYVDLQKSGLDTEDVRQMRDQMERSFDTLNTAFELQFQRIMREEMVDIHAEMQALEEMVKMEKE